jgi:hypothetical protein
MIVLLGYSEIRRSSYADREIELGTSHNQVLNPGKSRSSVVAGSSRHDLDSSFLRPPTLVSTQSLRLHRNDK